jgi:hypothetical protein
MNFFQEAKIQLLAKTARYDGIINELCHIYKVSLIILYTGLYFTVFVRSRMMTVIKRQIQTTTGLSLR